MTRLVHIGRQRDAARFTRGGIAARSRGRSGVRGVYAMATLPDYTLTHQWVRELRRWHPGVLVAVDLRIPDDTPVTVGRYGREPWERTAAEAAGLLREIADPRGYEIFIPRAITPAEVRGTRAVPQGIGWRYLPDAHGREPCTCMGCLQPGTPGVAGLRRRSPDFEPSPRKPELMAGLRAASSPEEIAYALRLLGGRSRGAAEELAYLVDHPDADVREALHFVLDNYRGRTARRLQEHLVARYEAEQA
ncbi:HEAT repeat domain-containing protein [Actinoplanes subglobosus]|uniref:HEAT repeat domain-containing protein n=1 Tax=Actinoplanes subglobosus TaxID=1547892 RepID=A0ABV8IVP1_9ACTN